MKKTDYFCHTYCLRLAFFSNCSLIWNVFPRCFRIDWSVICKMCKHCLQRWNILNSEKARTARIAIKIFFLILYRKNVSMFRNCVFPFSPSLLSSQASAITKMPEICIKRLRNACDYHFWAHSIVLRCVTR